LALLLEGAKKGIEFPHDRYIRAEVRVLCCHETEVEGVCIAWVRGGGNVLWIAEDAVVGCGKLDKAGVAESGVRDYEV